MIIKGIAVTFSSTLLAETANELSFRIRCSSIMPETNDEIVTAQSRSKEAESEMHSLLEKLAS